MLKKRALESNETSTKIKTKTFARKKKVLATISSKNTYAKQKKKKHKQ